MEVNSKLSPSFLLHMQLNMIGSVWREKKRKKEKEKKNVESLGCKVEEKKRQENKNGVLVNACGNGKNNKWIKDTFVVKERL